MVLNGKVWGKTLEIIKGSSFEVHRIEIYKHHYCSLHKHIHKNNLFFVEKGNIKIEVHKKEYDLIDETYLFDGDMTIVKPDELHRFVGIADKSIVYEIYWVDNIKDDIIRVKSGGIEND